MSSTRSNVSLPEDAITGRADRRPALESARTCSRRRSATWP